MPLNDRVLRLTVVKNPEFKRVLVAGVRPYIKKDFEEEKGEFFKAFDEDPVSEEIKDGPEASSHVSELKENGGNLFSLLGFFKEQQPIEQLRDYLESNIVLGQTEAGKVDGDKIVFTTPVLAPTEEEINAVVASLDETKLQWTNRSFTELLANGISGLPNYLFSLTRDFSHIPSRSGPAIQDKKKQRDADLGPIPYLERLLGVLTKIFSNRQ